MLLALLCATLLSPGWLVDDEADQPQSPPPKVMVATVGDNGRPFILITVTQMVPETRTIEVNKGGVLEKRNITVNVPVMQQKRFLLDDRDVQVYRADGKRVEPKDVARALPKKGAVLVSADGKPVDPLYLQLARDGTLVIVSPALVEANNPAMPLPTTAPPKAKVKQ